MTYEIITNLHPSAKNIFGHTFGRLTSIAPVEKDKNGKIKWLCVCECGSDTLVIVSNLTNGRTKSCGCLHSDITTKHGGCSNGGMSPEYKAWSSMTQRCSNQSHNSYKNYGGRGISVCSRWVKSFGNFISDMGKKPTPKHSIDRINNNGNYTAKNCRWATARQQGANMRSNVLLIHNGKTLTLTQWSRRIGIKRVTLAGRLNAGWSTERILTEPVHNK